MWALRNNTIYGAERNWIRDKDGVHHWVVAVQASFNIQRGGSLQLADVQTPPVLVPEYHGEPARSSLRFDSDLMALKPCTDILLDACAHAPSGRPARSVEVSCQFAETRKVLIVHGARTYYKSSLGKVMPSTAQAFEIRPIRYELAYGGADTTARDPNEHTFEARNPVGVGFTARPETLVNTPAPSVEYPDADHARAGPGGFGPIDRSWSPRREFAGTYDARWQRTKRPLLPEDYNELFASGAPADQRVSGHLRGGERIELRNLTPEGALRFEVPQIVLDFTTYFGSRREEHRARMTSVLIEAESMSLSLIWQSSIRVEPCDEEYLDMTVISEKS